MVFECGQTQSNSLIPQEKPTLESCKLDDEEEYSKHKRSNTGTTPLHWAFALGRPQVASCLLHFGADLNIRNENGDTPFEMADKFGTLCSSVGV